MFNDPILCFSYKNLNSFKTTVQGADDKLGQFLSQDI